MLAARSRLPLLRAPAGFACGVAPEHRGIRYIFNTKEFALLNVWTVLSFTARIPCMKREHGKNLFSRKFDMMVLQSLGFI